MRTKLLIILSIAIFSCNKRGINDNESIKVVDILSKSESEMTKLSEIAAQIEYIPLQTTENSLLGDIVKIVRRNNNIYIKNGYDEILCFNSKGTFLYKLDKLGRGPEEYKFIVDFDVSSDNKTLLIIFGDKIMIYNNTDTGFLFANSLKLNQPVPSKIDMIPGTNNILLSVDPMTGSEPSLSIIININGDTLNFKPNYYKFKKLDKFTRGIANESLHYDIGNAICFKEEFSDTVFFIHKGANKFQPRLILDTHGFGFSPRIRYDSDYARKHYTELYWIYSIIEVPRFIFYTYEHNRSRNKMIYDKSTNKKFKIAFKDAFIDDIIGGCALDPSFCSGGKIYTSVEVMTLKKHVDSEAFKSTKVTYPKRKK